MSAVGRLLLCVVTLLGVTMAGTAAAQDVVTSTLNKHNLSSSGPGPVKTSATTEVCIFCHAPHNSSPTAPLWNQTLSGATYTPYTSTTLAATANVPTGSSKLCLSCHDGTIAVASTLSRGQITMSGVSNGLLSGASNIGTNLTSSHPVSIVPVTGGEIINPPAGHAVALDSTGRLQCVSCHDPHQMNADTTTHKFLAMSNASSALCVTCHRKQYWASNPSSHMTSTKAYIAAQGAHTGYTTVATNACASCHKVHLAAQGPQLLKAREELTCGGTGSQCHSTTGIGRNIHAEFNKTYSHPSYSITPSVHDPAESPTSVTAPLPERTAGTPRHAECGDCHNAHASYNAAAAAPKASGKLAGVWGISRTGAMVLPSGTPSSVNEYEICFKCHGDSANLPQGAGGPTPPYPNRQAVQWNKRAQFDTAAVSFHPVAGPARATASPSLKAPWTLTSIITCTDCHDNDTGPNAPTPGTGPSGPHGSNIRHLLAGRYDQDSSSTTESAATYALCYKCHERSIVLSSASNREHNRHVVNERASCSICHDSHGIASGQGTTVNNAHLMNFDRRFVTPSSSGILRWEQTSTGKGRCYLTCHGENHNPQTY